MHAVCLPRFSPSDELASSSKGGRFRPALNPSTPYWLRYTAPAAAVPSMPSQKKSQSWEGFGVTRNGSGISAIRGADPGSACWLRGGGALITERGGNFADGSVGPSSPATEPHGRVVGFVFLGRETTLGLFSTAYWTRWGTAEQRVVSAECPAPRRLAACFARPLPARPVPRPRPSSSLAS